MQSPPKIVGNPADRSDPWALADSPDYSTDTFYVGYHGRRGDFAQINTKVSKALSAVIQGLIARGDLPYKTLNDFVRDALTHRAKFLVDELQNPSSQLERIVDTSLIESVLQQQESEEQERAELLQHIRQRVATLAGRNELVSLREVLEQAELLADAWSDFAHGRELAEFVRGYEHARRRQQIRTA